MCPQSRRCPSPTNISLVRHYPFLVWLGSRNLYSEKGYVFFSSSSFSFWLFIVFSGFDGLFGGFIFNYVLFIKTDFRCIIFLYTYVSVLFFSSVIECWTAHIVHSYSSFHLYSSLRNFAWLLFHLYLVYLVQIKLLCVYKSMSFFVWIYSFWGPYRILKSTVFLCLFDCVWFVVLSPNSRTDWF